MNKNPLMVAGVFVAVIAAGLFFLNKPKNTPSPTPSKEIVVSGSEYSFNPANITITKGEKIRLTFTNVGSQFHNLIINGIDVKTKTVATGKSDTIEFTASESGSFTFFCEIGNHQSLGMEGELRVE